ncbi:MAG: hypothetical protein UW68_C0012G0015 [Candidatus Collierbacteria bacterium GW2011_GWB1_44_6]|uniref:Uncharacterized protein n=2 Tax=Candidatus Collieribacteriota TaxID=1752725 RepID=A0A0G1LWW9_9BACT|nr:MAG: hypothetical protein UV68_C0027G0012 [Candidatus Collierbacteria bacterium GW2011_GWC2_43_12]KKT73322.1 MAG: hypothetical protein UW68_C0012G0015 [Candidatus Collierbacteria bacterium GW2011_GWB1_44_6]KKT82671.1 MAG: hypothetical protein UW80_C0033G0016 [Microgenomates group bacterium GW2011_GWC1_44_9]
MQTTSIIRERGQLTIPDAIRKMVGWVNPMSAVSISVLKPDEIVIRPHVQTVDWNKVWGAIRKSRAITGKGEVGASKFMELDRSSH